MSNRNGQGPMNTGSRTGRGRGFCSGNATPGVLTPETQQNQVVVQQQSNTDCRGPRGCGTGMNSGNGRRGCGSGNRRGQR
jgi:hypothetical protein